MMLERGVVFQSQGKQLVGVLHQTVQKSNNGVVIVVGGPQTRVGSHRLFVYIARALAVQGIAVFRFDYSGAGDSEGEIADFEHIQYDINDAINTFEQLQPHVKHITLWGLCDAASAILLYLNEFEHDKVNNLILVNPWVRQASTQARVYLKSYYTKRIFNRSFWKKLFNGKVNFINSLKELLENKRLSNSTAAEHRTPFIEAMYQGLAQFKGESLIILSGNDLTADEFNVLVENNKQWQQLILQSLNPIKTVALADHTFSDAACKEKLLKLTLELIE
ncbi:hydrolase 1, exosortase A system-associated [Litorilituus lipolyticus]|uniref:Hydrolase 1, exosortase A system-associated n=1 Tax=Litorilituus lipolyticus TaxID=2491017 RepID=A0A502KWV1_9GAMM|nr:hydrolase 1, exosortase A system-associated [Litorilituus lipolyticus]TPH15554.1 hydrolase 1, exosortase A system-associated [Litorilituus lipolyticus]